MRTCKRLGAVVAAALLMLTPMAAAHAEPSSTLEVASVDGREVSLVMTVDPRVNVDPTASVQAAVEIDGTVIPATTSLEVSEDTRPDTAILVLDASGSMSGARIKAARQAASGFINAMSPQVSVGLVTFNDNVRVIAEPTRDRASLAKAITAVKPTGDTSLYDAVIAAIAQVPAGARARIVVLSDGKDTVSRATLARVQSAVGAADTPVDVVSIQPSAQEITTLRSIADAGDGSVRTTSSATELVRAFADASTAFGARVRLGVLVPDSIDASGKTLAASVAIGSQVLDQTTQLPRLTSLQPVVDAAEAVPTASPSAAIPASTMRDTVLPITLALLVALCLFLIAYVIIKARHQRRTAERIEQVLHYRTGSQHSSASLAMSARERPARLVWLDRQLARVIDAKAMAAKLSAAEFDLTPAAWLLVRVGAALVLIVVTSLVVRSIWIGLLVGIVLAWLGSWMVLQSRVAKRQRAFADSLPDFLMLLASGLRAGLSFTHALETAAEEDKGEVGRQIRRALREVQVGASLDSALMDCANRMNNEDLRWTVTALGVQREVGGNLSSILDSAATTIKGRYELRREVRTLSAEGRLSAYILVALPLGVFAFLVVFRREYISLLWTDPLGIVMLVGLALAMLVGWLWMRSIVRIKV